MRVERRAERGRPSVGINVAPSVLDLLDEECKQRGVTRSAAIEAAVLTWLGRPSEPEKTHGGPPPFGKRREGGVLVDDVDELKTIDRVKELRLTGLSHAKIAAQLTEEGHLSRAGTPYCDVQIVGICKRLK